MHVSKKGIEMVWWTLIALVMSIVVFLIFFYLIKNGVLQIGSVSNTIFSAPEQFAK